MTISKTRIAALCLGAIAPLTILGSASAADPSSNTAPNALNSCSWSSAAVTTNCVNGFISDANTARAKESGVPSVSLPSNFASLSNNVQQLTLVNLERVDRGLPPIVGLNTTLDADAQQGVNANTDPPAPAGANGYVGNWCGCAETLYADFIYMYDDGYGGMNADCTTPTNTNCWGHRHDILTSWSGFPNMEMGAANNGSNSSAYVFTTYDSSKFPINEFWWTSESPYMAGGANSSVVRTPTYQISSGTGTLAMNLEGNSATHVSVQRWNGSSWVTTNAVNTASTNLSDNIYQLRLGPGMASGSYRVQTSSTTSPVRFNGITTKTVTVG